MNNEQQYAELESFFKNLFILVGHEIGEAEENSKIFLKQAMMMAVTTLIEKRENYKDLVEEFSKIVKVEDFSGFITKHFSAQEAQKAYVDSVSKLTQDYIIEIKDSLSPEQSVLVRVYLQDYLKKYE